MNVFGVGTQGSEQEAGKGEENDTEHIEEIVSERFMKIHELRRSAWGIQQFGEQFLCENSRLPKERGNYLTVAGTLYPHGIPL